MITQPQETGPVDDADAQVGEAWANRAELVLYARRLLAAQGELAEDIVQEAYLRLHERATSGQPVREARPWLFRVTRNLALDERRRSRRGDEVRTSLEVVAARPRGPLEVLQGREEARQALEGLDALPPRERHTVILDQAGLAPTAIARRMQTTTNAVHQSLFRARRRMRDARAAAWGLLPLPIIRLMLRAASSPAIERLPAVTPGSGGRLAGGAGLVGLVAAAVIGGGVVADQPVIPHPVHARAVASAAPSPAPAPTPAATHVRAAAGTVSGAAAPARATRSSVALVGDSPRAGGEAREAPERQDGPEPEGSDPVEGRDREVEDSSERARPEGGEHEDAVVRREEPEAESSESRSPETRAPEAPAPPADEPEHEAEPPEEPSAPEPD